MLKSKGFTLIELISVIVLLGILGATAAGKSQKLAGAARSSAVQNLAASIQSAAMLNAMSFYTSPCYLVIGDGAGSVGTVALYYRQVYSGDWEPRFGENCFFSFGTALNGIPEIMEALNISEDKLNNYWMLHNRQNPAPRPDALWIAPFPPSDKKGVRIVAHNNTASRSQVNELEATNCYIKYSTPLGTFVTASVETVTTGC